MKTQSQTKQGFTMIQVLVVSAAIVVILTVIFFAFRPNLINKYYDIKAIRNLRGYFNAYTMYCNDHDNKEPVGYGGFLRYNPGGQWDAPKKEFGPGCWGSGLHYARVYPIPEVVSSVDFVNPYRTNDQAIIKALHRCKNLKGVVTYYVNDSRNGGLLKQERQNQRCPGIMKDGSIKEVLTISPFEVEFGQYMMSGKFFRDKWRKQGAKD